MSAANAANEAGATPRLVPREVLFGNPERVSPRVSPDGRRLAWIAPDDGVLNVWVAPLGHGELDARAVTADRDRGIRQYFWAHDNRHLLYIQDQGGDENWRLHAVEVDSGTDRDLTPFDGVQARVDAINRDFPDTLLVGLNRDDPALHDTYKLTLSTGELEKIFDNPGFAAVVADEQLTIRAAMAFGDDAGLTILVRDTDSPDAEWRPLLQVSGDDALTTQPVGFSGDGNALYVLTSHGANATRLIRVALTDGTVDVLAGDATYDIQDVIRHPETREPQLVVYEKERLAFEVLDPSIAADIETLRAADPGDLSLEGRDHADRIWLAGFMHDDGPIKYYSYDRDAKAMDFLFDHRSALNDYELATLEPFTLTSRDGLALHGYATFPLGAERTKLPTVLNVHGGPWARDAWGYAPEAQWFANRGYLCIQVNFRGSTGYGKDFVNAGDREWGAKMHDDLVDTVQHAIDQGWADPDRVAIYGGSYGGYAALVGATFTPDLFCCAVDIVGPSNLETLIRSIPPYWAPMVSQFHRRVGNPDTEPDFMRSRSPLFKAGEIKIPLLIAQGANDPRVKQAESEQIVAALRENGVPHEYMLFADEGHGFAKPENRLRFYAAAEAFLAKHLGGRAEP